MALHKINYYIGVENHELFIDNKPNNFDWKRCNQNLKNKPRWRKSEIELLIKIYATTPIQELVLRIEHTAHAIRCKASKLKLKKKIKTGFTVNPQNRWPNLATKEEIKEHMRLIRGLKVVKIGQIVKWKRGGNKEEYYIRLKKHNKTSDYKRLSIYKYERYNGNISNNDVVCYKDGNSKHCIISNLVLKTRQQLAKENTNRAKAAETRKKLIENERLRMKYGLKQKSKLKLK